MLNAPVIGGTVFALVCLYLTRYAITSRRRANQSLSWPSVTGTLSKVHLWGKRLIDGEMKPVDHLSVEYQYEVDGVQCEGKTVAFYTLVYPETTEFASTHPEGSQARVFYDPNDPAYSTLIVGPHKTKKHSGLILGVLGTLLGLIIVACGLFGIIG